MIVLDITPEHRKPFGRWNAVIRNHASVTLNSNNDGSFGGEPGHEDRFDAPSGDGLAARLILPLLRVRSAGPPELMRRLAIR
ncbi:hypothetical protein BV898_19925, partial [Hypsibius exemplaris]